MAVFRLGLQLSQWLSVSPSVVQPSRFIKKHWNPKFKKLRREKVIKVKLPDYRELEEEKNSKLTHEQVRARLRRHGIQPVRPWSEKSFLISCTGGILEAYVPPEGDGKASIVSTAGAKQKFTLIEKKSKSYLTVRKIRSFDENFNTTDFPKEAQDIYVRAHTFLANHDRLNLRDVVTERCYPEMLHDSICKTIHWKFLQSLEPPRVVHARHADVITKENLFAQVTVRFHTQQQLAIYDRFGRLMYGSEILAKDVIEYVVFEKHLSNSYGLWRVHSKIIPDWMPPREPGMRTFIKEDEPVTEEASNEIVAKDADVSLSKPVIEQNASTSAPALAQA